MLKARTGGKGFLGVQGKYCVSCSFDPLNVEGSFDG